MQTSFTSETLSRNTERHEVIFDLNRMQESYLMRFAGSSVKV